MSNEIKAMKNNKDKQITLFKNLGSVPFTYGTIGFYCMQEVLKREYLLKSIIIKNFEETRGKRNQGELWRYRALVGGFYIFKHEYVMLFKKK